jgi:hypothetical protein
MTKISEVESGELVVIKEVDIPALFKEKGCDPIIEGLKKEAAKFEGDISTAAGRKEIASFAFKFSKAKTYIDKLGKVLTDEYRDKIKPIQAERNKIEACCDELRDKVRKPLTEWEDAEKKRVFDIEERIDGIQLALAHICEDSEQAKILLDRIKAIEIDDSFEEFVVAAAKTKDSVVMQLEAQFIVLQNAEKEKAEAERLEKERLEKEQKDREEKIAEEAAEQAKEEAEERARLESLEKDRLAQEAIEKAEKETLEAKLETERVERESRESADRAEEDKRVAIEAELNRLATIKKADDEAEEKRQANKRHRNKIHKEAKGSMMEHGLSEEDATIFVTMVKDGLVKHIKIDY